MYQNIQKELIIHAQEELQHATILAAQIDYLGGVPSVNVPAAKISSGRKKGRKKGRFYFQRKREPSPFSPLMEGQAFHLKGEEEYLMDNNGVGEAIYIIAGGHSKGHHH